METGVQLHTFGDEDDLAQAAAGFIGDRAQAAVAARGAFTIALSGGSTPLETYARLPEAFEARRLDWSRTHVFWGDERCVPLDHPSSNYRSAQSRLLGRVPIPEAHVHPIRCAGEPERGAEAYEATLRKHFEGLDWPRFDLVLLGLGADGHTASLFPGSELLEESERWAAATYARKLDSWRVSLTPPALNAAACVAFLVTGEGKAVALWNVLEGPRRPEAWPAQIVRPEASEVHWFLDRAAGAKLGE